MKPSSSNDDNNNGWLGFSLSPHMKMESNTPTNSSPSFFLSNNCYENGVVLVGDQNGDFNTHHHLSSIMPLKSDGSLCIMEALSASHSQGMVHSSSSPKLEDFLSGCATSHHHHHQYSSISQQQQQQQQRDAANAMFLSLESGGAYFNQHQQQNHYNNYTALNYDGIYHMEQQHQNSIQQMSNENEIPCLKTWIEQNHHALEQQQVINSNNTTTCMVENGGGDLQSLSLSMSPINSQSSCVVVAHADTTTTTTMENSNNTTTSNKKRGSEKIGATAQKQTVHRKSIDTFGQRTSQYRGVTRHRWTGRYEAHLWDNSCKKEGQTRKGRQVYLGGYDMEEKAARAYDLAALKYWGPSTHINFPSENYQHELEEMKNMSRQECVAHLRRRSSGFSRGASMYRGVTRHHQHGRWQARIGRVAGNKDLYLGTFSTQEEAAEAYDIAAIKFRGANAVTNFDISRYDVEKIMASNTLPTGDIARRNKDTTVPNAEVTAIGYKTTPPPDLRHEESFSQKMSNVANYPNSSFSVALHDLIGIGSTQTLVDESSTSLAPHYSNPSSLVTSLGSSREASPDRNSGPLLYAKPSSNAENKFITPSSNVNPWFPLTMAHLPVFATWDDA